MTTRHAARGLLLVSALCCAVFGWLLRSARAQRGAAAGEDVAGKEVVKNEKEVWEAVKRKDALRFDQLVADDARIIFDTGILTKTDFLKSLPNRTISSYDLEDFIVLRPNARTVILIYKATRSGAYKDKPFPPSSVHEGSVWVQRGGKWVAVLNQETPILP